MNIDNGEKDKGSPIAVSVIIPTYNRIRSLEDAIKSVHSQTYGDFELIIVDDGSTDGTDRLIEKSAPDAVYIRQENRGVSSARNRGILASRGKYIAFLDSDDRWLDEKLSLQVKAMDEGHLVSHTEEIWIRNGVRVNPGARHRKHSGNVFVKSLPLVIISLSSVIIRREVFDDVGLFDEKLLAAEDYDMWLRITARYPVHFIERPLIVKTGGHRDQLSRRYWGLDMLRIYALEKILRSGVLDGDERQGDRIAVMEEIVKKAKIVGGGAKKRGNIEGEIYFKNKAREYEEKIQSSPK
ncbi:MAG: glycosyltransferase family 2 protein [Deltaproteobacteria bacterium]|uniref:Glycosyltransferase family 2 protein n=1 Tax=Candidatus Zymogenus saltonus TaxID=2844893 RepID=A0A9D8KCN0_9DELT|nr:glycosyltransferase family 2 protein [Candidatus Zymogenus saltonus]